LGFFSITFLSPHLWATVAYKKYFTVFVQLTISKVKIMNYFAKNNTNPFYTCKQSQNHSWGKQQNGYGHCPEQFQLIDGIHPLFFFITWSSWMIDKFRQSIGKNNNTHTVQAESSKFASLLFDHGFQIVIRPRNKKSMQKRHFMELRIFFFIRMNC
jgi:hypothetical protein